MNCGVFDFSSYKESVPMALEQAGLIESLNGVDAVIIKPNLVNASPFPVTTRAECCAEVARYIQSISQAKVVIAEGSGEPSITTMEIFRKLGYQDEADELGIELVDLNNQPLRKLSNPACKRFPEMYLPEIAFTHFILSVPVLKAHSLADITGSLKSMMGFAPPEHYSGQAGIWLKAAFHNRMHDSIRDLNTYRTPDFTLVDASVGLADYHLGGATCEPPVNKLVAGSDSKLVDRKCAELLGLDWKTIPHLAE